MGERIECGLFFRELAQLLSTYGYYAKNMTRYNDLETA